MSQRQNTLALILGAIALVAGITAAIRAYWPVESAIVWQSLDEAKTMAAREGKPVYLDIYAEWCGPCKKMERDVFPDEDVKHLLTTQFIAARMDIDDPSVTDAVKASFYLQGVPTSIIYNPNGIIVARRVGYLSAKDLLAMLNDSTLVGYSPWFEFGSAFARARERRQSIALFVVQNHATLKELQGTFSISEFRRFVDSRFVSTLLVSESPNERAMLDSLQIERREIPNRGVYVVVYTVGGTRRGSFTLERKELSDGAILRKNLEGLLK